MKSRGILTFLITISVSCTSAIDLPTFYRAPFFQGIATNHDDEWKTSIQLRVGSGDTCQSYDTKENKTCLFNEHGPFNLTALGLNVEDKDKKPITSIYWAPDCKTGKFDELTQRLLGDDDGRFVFGGKFDITELDITIRQNLLWGFYVQVYVPHRDLKIKDITARRKGAEVINTVRLQDANDNINDPAAATTTEAVNMDTFFKDDFPKILTECGLCPFDREFKKSAISDVVLSAGWHKYKDNLEEGPITFLSGLVQTGLLIPMASEVPSNQIFAVPAGYNNQFGSLTRIKFEAGLWDWVALGFNLGALIFFRDDKCMRLKTDTRQNGWIKLEHGKVNFDQGTIWDIGAYLRTGWRWVKGLSLILGYSYNKKEQTKLRLEDDRVLKTFAKKQLERCKDTCPNKEFPIVVSKDEIINCDWRLAGWELQAVHAAIEFDTSQQIKGGCYAPFIRFEYSAPIAGKHFWQTSMIGAALGLVVSWDF